MEFFAKYLDGTVKSFRAEEKRLSGEAVEYSLRAELIPKDIEYLSFHLTPTPVKAGEEGYFIIPNGVGYAQFGALSPYYGIGYFKEQEDRQVLISEARMPVYGYKHGELCRTAIVKGMKHDVVLAITVSDGEYLLELRFVFGDHGCYEDVSLELHDINGGNVGYSEMARIYRNYQLANGFVSLKDRNNPIIENSAACAGIRIRMGWKPVPCQIPDQTPENEPPVHVACTFDDVSKLLDEYKKVGISNAEVCLVGWNMRGHDGRWPQALPVEESLGGEQGLRRLLAHAKELGYRVCCHTNSTEAYTVAECFNENDLAVKTDGELWEDNVHWAGGRSYKMCPRRAYETLDDMLMPVAELGFNGTHYIDVITCIPARECFSRTHPLNKTQGVDYWNKLLGRAKELFGSVGSEGPFDHSLKNCDTSLYVTGDYKRDAGYVEGLLDEQIPFWELVYHGIVMSTPSSRTLNSIISTDPDDTIRVIEYGGKPQLYYNAHFVDDGSDWIGRNDFYCHTDEERRFGAQKLKETMDIFGKLSFLQYEFMEKHEKLSEGVYRTCYSDGTAVTVDYVNKSYKLEKGEGVE